MITLPEGSETFLRAGVAVCGAVLALLVFSLAVWTARDISARSRDTLIRLGALAVVLGLPVVGLAVYLLLRPRDTLADRYERQLVEEILTREIGAAAAAAARAPDQPPQPRAGS